MGERSICINGGNSTDLHTGKRTACVECGKYYLAGRCVGVSNLFPPFRHLHLAPTTHTKQRGKRPRHSQSRKPPPPPLSIFFIAIQFKLNPKSILTTNNIIVIMSFNIGTSSTINATTEVTATKMDMSLGKLSFAAALSASASSSSLSVVDTVVLVSVLGSMICLKLLYNSPAFRLPFPPFLIIMPPPPSSISLYPLSTRISIYTNKQTTLSKPPVGPSKSHPQLVAAMLKLKIPMPMLPVPPVPTRHDAMLKSMPVVALPMM